MNYYNEFDPKAAAWLRELIKAGLIPSGEVDERSITDVRPDELAGFRQCHFFAGIGGWPYALALVGWPADREVWTGSCPCQPWSNANVNGLGIEDKRHLWPSWFRLICERQPNLLFGEQVYGAVRKGWIDVAALDLESVGYAFASIGIPAMAVGADHERARIWFCADAQCKRWERHQQVIGIFESTKTPHTVTGYSFTGARSALDGDYRDILPCDGLSVAMERDALKGYGNAIVPQVAAEFIKAYLEAERLM